MNHHPVIRWTVFLASLGLVFLALLAAGQVLAQERAPTAPLGVNAPLGTSFTYQGQLKDGSGNPITDTCDFRFILYDTGLGGAQVGPILDIPVSVAGGYFTVALDFGSTAFTGEARWLEVAVKCSGDADYSSLTPRQALTAAPYALGADLLDGQHGSYFLNASNINAGTLGTGYYSAYGDLSAEGYLDLSVGGDLLTRDQGDGRYATTAHTHWGQTWSGSGTGLTLSGGATGLSGSGSTYGVYGTSVTTNGAAGYFTNTSGSGTDRGWGVRAFTGSGGPGDVHPGGNYLNAAGEFAGPNGLIGAASSDTDGYGVIGISAGAGGFGVYGNATATSDSNYGVYGRSSSIAGTGVRGAATATTGDTYGVYGRSYSTDGYGVYGWASATTGNTFGVYGQSDSDTGKGVYGYSPHIGVYGESDSDYGLGVYGRANATSGNAAGVRGFSNSISGVGVSGFAGANSGVTFGVYGEAESSEGFGVYGWANALSGTTYGVYGETYSSEGFGVYGLADATSGTTYGVYGRTDSPSGRGVFGIASTATGTNYGVRGATNSTDGYGVYSVGNMGATGTKSAVVEAQDYGWLHLYAMESPEVLFEDVGTAQLVNGMAVVTIDPKFAGTVNLSVPYQVFLTPRGNCGLYLAETTPTSFIVRALGDAKCSLAFDYRLIAKRLGYEDVRMAPATDPAGAQDAMLPGGNEPAMPEPEPVPPQHSPLPEVPPLPQEAQP